MGLEPTTFGLEVQRAIHCATRACPSLRKIRAGFAVMSNYPTHYPSSHPSYLEVTFQIIFGETAKWIAPGWA